MVISAKANTEMLGHHGHPNDALSSPQGCGPVNCWRNLGRLKYLCVNLVIHYHREKVLPGWLLEAWG